ncbi:hypothetical protein ACQEVF_56615 [Nonomuraea polychroma]|uniref:hypothetical protein n=1 Tax=Nonomuraea polychroma TaxID=46176 RepID=UPI003D8FB809
MPLPWTHWDKLPAPTQAAVQEHTGPIRSARTIPDPHSSAVAAVLTTDRGHVFTKGLRRAHPSRWTHHIQEQINASVARIAPRMLWRVQDEQWDLLGFEYVDGRHAVYEPGSPDLALLTTTMTIVGRLPCPDVPLRSAADRWRPYLDNPDDEHWLTGDSLLHTDYDPRNVLICDGRAALLDWASAAKGAAWIDAASLIPWLIAGGHTPQQAETVISDIPVWKAAASDAVDVFASANERAWDEIARRSMESELKRLARAAQRWHSHREGNR